MVVGTKWHLGGRFFDWGLGLEAAGLSPSGVEPVLTGRSGQGVEHALPDFVGWGVHACGR